MLATQLHLVARLRMSVELHLFSPVAIMVWRGTTLPLLKHRRQVLQRINSTDSKQLKRKNVKICNSIASPNI